MSSVNPEKINLSEYEEYRPQRSSNEAWNHVKRYHKVTQEEGYKDIWICNYCNQIHTGNVNRVEAHLAGIKEKGVTYCPEVPPEVKEKMRHVVRGKDVDLRETKRRNPLPYASQSKSSGLIPIAEGNPSNFILGITNQSGEVSPQSAEMGRRSFADPHGSTGLLSDVVGQTTTSGLGNSQLGGGGNISNPAQPQQPSGTVSMAVDPMSMLSQPSILGEMAGFTATCAQGADAGLAIRSGSSPLHPNGEAGNNNSSSLAHQLLPPGAVSMEMPGMGVSSQWSNLHEIQERGMAGPEDAGAGCSNSTFPEFVFHESNHRLDFNESANSSNPACQPQIPGIAMVEPNSLRNIANGPVGPRGPEAGGLDIDVEELDDESFNRTVERYIKSIRKFLSIECSVSSRKTLFEKVEHHTTRMKEMDRWLKSAAPVRQEAVDLLVNIGFTPEQVRQLPKIDISTKQVRQLTDDLFAKRTVREIVQLQKKMEELRKQIKKLKKESEHFFSQIPLEPMLLEFMTCRWDSSLKELYLFNKSEVYIRSEPWGKCESISREMATSVSRFIERARKFSIRVSSVCMQKANLVEIGVFATRRIKEIHGWLKSAEQLRSRAVDLLLNIGFTSEQISQLSKIDISVEQVRQLSDDLLEKRPVKEIFQLLKRMEELGKQFKKLKKESEDFFNPTSLKTVLIEFITCRWDSSLKDSSKEPLPLPLAC